MIKDKTKPIPVVSHSAGQARVAPESNVLEDRLMHRIFVLSHLPATWAAWQLAIGLLVIAFIIQLAWLPLGLVTYLAAGTYLLFAGTDWLLLRWLPRTGRSFGPVGPQLFVMTIPRLAVGLLSAFLAGIFGLFTGLGVLILLQLCGSVVYLWGTLREPFALAMTPMTIQMPDWPAGTPALRLLHLSDLHVERLTHREAKLLELVEQANPDLIVITGDYLNLSYVDEPTARAEVRRVLDKLAAPYGVYATLGSPPVDPRNTTPSLFDDLPIRLLRDEAVILGVGHGRRVALLGR